MAQRIILLLATLSAASSAQSWRPAFEKLTLPNGMSVVIHRDTTIPYVSMNLAFHAGSAWDPKGLFGLATAAGNLYLAALPANSAGELRKLREEATFSHIGLTNVDWNNIAVSAPARLLDPLLRVEAERMKARGEAITDTMLAAAVRSLVARREQASRQPLSDSQEMLFKELYPDGHPYSHISTGDTADVRAVTLADVRKCIGIFFVPANASMTIGGDISVDAVKRLVKKYFGGIPGGKKMTWQPELKTIRDVPATSLVRTAQVDFSTLKILVPTAAIGDPDEAVLKLLAQMLAGSTDSRLRSFFRSHPGILDIQASQSSQELHGVFDITVTARSETNLRPVFDHIFNLLSSMVDGVINDAELQTAANLAEMQYLTPMEKVFGLGGRCDVMNLDNLYTGNPAASAAAIESLDGVNVTAVRSVIKRYFNSDRAVVLSVVQPNKTDNAVVFQ